MLIAPIIAIFLNFKSFISLSARRVSDITLFRRLPVLDLIGGAQRKLFEFTD
jgi:hypothetical protein